MNFTFKVNESSVFITKGNSYMPQTSAKHPKNVSGKYYVDDSCIDCDMCRSIAPNHLQRDEVGDGHSYVYRQPATEEEIKICEEALQGCPTDSIGNDG